MSNPAAWQAVQQTIKEAFNLDQAAPLLEDADNLQPSVPQISFGFTFTKDDEDEEHFPYLHIEPLLDECAALLDRSLADRTVYQNLGVEFF